MARLTLLRSVRSVVSTKRNNAFSALSVDSMNPNVKNIYYAVRGPIVDRAVQIEADLSNGSTNYPFSDVIKCNIGDAHAMGQQPITWIRQVLQGVVNPSSLPTLPKDVQERARMLLEACGGNSMGSYSASAGLPLVRQHIADYITARDKGVPSSADDIFLTAGASPAIVQVLKMNTHGSGANRTGVLIPTPQYPLYSAVLAEHGSVRCNYYLDEENKWSLSREALEKAFEEAEEHCTPRVLCVINPGNPTGNVQTIERLQDIIKFAYDNNLFLMADEVYQDNVYASGMRFHSMKSVCYNMGEPYRSSVQMASFHSISKGYMGECGLRGGYAELYNWDPSIKAEFMKLLSARLCPTVLGQAAMDCVVKPPQEGSESYPLFYFEKRAILKGLKEKAKITAESFNKIDGISCQPIQGAMYSFPRFTLPDKFISDCKQRSVEPDAEYCMQLLESKGVCVVPGSGFGQEEGTFHFRMTILPPKDKMIDCMSRFESFHSEFLQKWT